MDATRDYTDPTATARAMMAEVQQMLADGETANDGTTMTLEDLQHGGFSRLHDYCDANTLGNLCDDVADYYTEHGLRGEGVDEHGQPVDPWIDHGNTATDIVDLWLRAGMPPVDGDDARGLMLGAECGGCGGTFVPSDVADQIHIECGGLARHLTVVRPGRGTAAGFVWKA